MVGSSSLLSSLPVLFSFFSQLITTELGVRYLHEVT